jgi:ketosteroid isomerase-like protein
VLTQSQIWWICQLALLNTYVRTPMTPLPDQVLGIERTPHQLGAELACHDLIHAFADHIDRGAATEAIDLFTDDAEAGNAEQRAKGRNEIARALAAREADASRRTCHQVTNIMFQQTGPNTATAHSLLCLFVLDGQQELTIRAISRLDDQFARDSAGQWRFSRRVATMLAGAR